VHLFFISALFPFLTTIALIYWMPFPNYHYNVSVYMILSSCLIGIMVFWFAGSETGI